MNPNSAILDQQLLAPALEVAGMKLRPFSAGVLLAAQKVGIRLLVGTDSDEKISQTEKNYELMEILFLLAAPIETVKKSVAGDRARFRSEFVEPFAFEVPVSELGKIAEALQALSVEVAAAAVEVVPKPTPAGAENDPTPPPNS